jgi:hypothetical protein
MRDADPKAWRDALVELESMRCRHLIPGYGPVGNCADITPFARYLSALERRVDALMNEGIGLAELRYRCDLPEFTRWDQYETLHPQNANACPNGRSSVTGRFAVSPGNEASVR